MKKYIFLAIGVIIILLVSSFMGILPFSLLGGGEYHTGITKNQVNNCLTEHHKVATTWLVGQDIGSWYGNIQKDYGELIRLPFDNGPVVTAMSSGEGKRSISISMYGTATYIGVAHQLQYWWPDYGYYTVEYSGNGITWNKILDTSNGQINSDIIGDVSGTYDQMIQYSEINPQSIPGFPSPVVSRELDPVEFNIKDAQVGALRIKQIGKFTALLGTQTTYETLSTDYVFLISGHGNVDIVDPQTRYIAGEDTVRLRVDTGYSGYTQGGTYTSRGWELKIYDNYGSLRKTWYIDDDKQGGRYDRDNNVLDFPIPEDAVTSGQSHTWRVVLTNTLFNQDDEVFFAITKEELAQAPDIKPVKFHQDGYELGDTVVILLEGIPNPEGRNTIDGFLVNVMYGKDGTDYIENYHLKYISASGYKATISFEASKGDTYITVEAWAFDYPEASGGIMSEKETAHVWVKENIPNPIVEEINWIIIGLCAIIIIIGLIIGFLMPSLPLKILIPIIFVIIAILVYLYYGMGIF